MKNQLFSFYIKQDTEFTSLSRIAISQLILKIIYMHGKRSSYESIQYNINKIILGTIDENELKSVLEDLCKKNVIDKVHNKYGLKHDTRSLIEAKEKEYSKLHDDIFQKWFNNTSAKGDEVRKWFEDILVKFFELFKYEWIEEICRKKPALIKSYQNLKSVFEESFKINQNIQDEDKQWLEKRFIEFLSSDDPDDHKLMWLYGNSMFMATLISAKQYGDSITIEMFRDSHFLLDTNVLMSLGLEGSDLADSLNSLEKVIQKLNVSLYYLNISREEYQRAAYNKKMDSIRLIENYELAVLEEMDDDYMRTALKRECKNISDFERIFDALLDIPSTFHESIPIQLLDNQLIQDAILFGEKDDTTQKKLNDISIARKKGPKRDKTKVHDASLICAAKTYRKENNCWIITRDGTVKKYAVQNTLRDEYPIAIGLDVLINLLAFNSASNHDSDSFAPLFANLVKLSILPEKDAFTIEDLSYILDTRIEINQLPKDKVIEIAKGLNKQRISGISDSEINLSLRREFQRSKLDLESDVDKLQQEVASKEQTIEKKDIKIKELSKSFSKERKEKFVLQDGVKIFFYGFLLILLIVVNVFIVIYIVNNFKSNDSLELLIISFFTGAVVDFLLGYKFIFTNLYKNMMHLKNIDKYIND